MLPLTHMRTAYDPFNEQAYAAVSPSSSSRASGGSLGATTGAGNAVRSGSNVGGRHLFSSHL